jgi:hypothetical protein
MRGRIAVLLFAIMLAFLGGAGQAPAAGEQAAIACRALGYTVTLPSSWPATGLSCSPHLTIAGPNHLSSLTINVYTHGATSLPLMSADLEQWLAPVFRPDPPNLRRLTIHGIAFVVFTGTLGSGANSESLVTAETYHDGRLYLLNGLSVGTVESTNYLQGIASIVFSLRLERPTGPVPAVALSRTTLGVALSRFERDLGAPSGYTASVDLYSWRPCTAANREMVEVRFSHAVAYRIALLNCNQINLPNYLAIVGRLLPEDATPIGATTSTKLGLLNLYYSQELHDVLPAAMRADRANRHDCAGRPVAAGTLFVGQSQGVIAVGLGGCES